MSISDPAQAAAIESENPVVTAINAGGDALTQDGIEFLADQFFTEGFTFGDIEGGNGLQPIFTNTVYQTERYGNFSYAIPVASTSQAYTVELRFGELWWSNPGQRVFDVTLEGQTILNDLDILAQTGSFNTPYTYVSGPITAGANGTLDLQFASSIDNAQLSGIIVRQANTLTGGPGSDYLVGGVGVDVLSGGAGDDALIGHAGNDLLHGDDGNDTLDGGLNADHMSGGLGDDVYGVDDLGDVVIEASDAGFDTVYSSISYVLPADVEAMILTGLEDLSGTGNDGANTLAGNAGHNVLTGGGGNDLYGVDGNGDTVVEAIDGGYDEVYSSGDYTMAENIETLFLTGSAVYATGNATNNAIIGNDLDNVIDAGAGDFEFINGAGGNDLLIGGAGHDEIMGGTGNDVFRFTSLSDAGDFFFDFTPGEDKIQLNATAFGIGTAVNQFVNGVSFIEGPDVTSAAPTVLYNKDSGYLLYDADGTGAAGPSVLALLNGTPTLHASDFMFY
ncbi:malectin domain-containing carbohydrate-binding protein [Methylorubrum extorquens]